MEEVFLLEGIKSKRKVKKMAKLSLGKILDVPVDVVDTIKTGAVGAVGIIATDRIVVELRRRVDFLNQPIPALLATVGIGMLVSSVAYQVTGDKRIASAVAIGPAVSVATQIAGMLAPQAAGIPKGLGAVAIESPEPSLSIPSFAGGVSGLGFPAVDVQQVQTYW